MLFYQVFFGKKDLNLYLLTSLDKLRALGLIPILKANN